MNAFPASRVKRALVGAAAVLAAAAFAVCLWLPGMNAGLDRRIEGAKQFNTYPELAAHMGVPPGNYRLHDRVTTLYPSTHYGSPKNLSLSSLYPGNRTAIWSTDKYKLYVVYNGQTDIISDCAILRPVENPFQPVPPAH